MQHLPGETIRQVRRLRHLTQRELGGDRYSKSYVSAEALRFFARRLGQADGNFATLMEQPDIKQALAAHHDLATAGQAYVGFGSLRYATLFPATAPSAASALSSSSTPEEIERAFERASGFLHQGVGFCRTGGDRLGEARACLTLASLQLDWAAWRRRRTMPDQLPTRKKKSAQALSTTLLDDVAEH
jgi:hypothetical protein